VFLELLPPQPDQTSDSSSVLVAVEGKSYADVSQILDLKIDAVRMRMARARKQLRSILKPYLKEE